MEVNIAEVTRNEQSWFENGHDLRNEEWLLIQVLLVSKQVLRTKNYSCRGGKTINLETF